MKFASQLALRAGLGLLPMLGTCAPTMANGDLDKLNHIIIIVQENHSFDNYFGALPYAPNTPYRVEKNGAACGMEDHDCVDGLSACKLVDFTLTCANSSPHLNNAASPVFAFHSANRCTKPDLDHEWPGSHLEANFQSPANTLENSLNNGFVATNDFELPDTGRNGPADGSRAMGFYTQDDIPFYYDVAQKFAISDRYFSSVLGPTFPNRAYIAAATSFGHLTGENAAAPRPDGYKPLTGTIYDLLTKNKVNWAESFQDVPQGATFLHFTSLTDDTKNDPHFIRHQTLLNEVSGAPGAAPLQSVVFVNPKFGFFGSGENDEHPSFDIQRGQKWVGDLVNAVRNGPFWKDTAIIITYDEGGGFYDHVAPPKAPQGGSRTPDGIAPGQCADASNLPASSRPGVGINCPSSASPGNSFNEVLALCPAFAANPTGPYPAQCPSFDQLGFRVPLMVISPFAKPHYVSHTIADHTSMLALIEKRFLRADEDGTETVETTGIEDDRGDEGNHKRGKIQHLTARDQYADTLEDMFDFDDAPSLHARLIQPLAPALDCSPN